MMKRHNGRLLDGSGASMVTRLAWFEAEQSWDAARPITEASLDVRAPTGPRDRGRALRIARSADVAQLVERRLPKPKVAGSRPVVRLQNLARLLRISPQTTGFWQWFDSRRTCEDRRGWACAAELEVASWSHRPEQWMNCGQSLTQNRLAAAGRRSGPVRRASSDGGKIATDDRGRACRRGVLFGRTANVPGGRGRGLMAGRAVANRSESLAVMMQRGRVEVVRQQWRSRRTGSRWQWESLARRGGQRDWKQGSTAREAIRQAMLLSPGKQPGWADRGG